ncbi:MAG: electron transfer flavoprotein subunit beta/FixA family protein [Bacillota bacterium]|jgi:electron transfer flavoprotein beta subunit
MRFVVCIKQVPETTEVQIDPDTRTLMREGIPCIINPFDTYAIEEALKFRESAGGEVTVISMGPPQAEEALKEALAMGADQAILLSDPGFRGADTLATARTLAAGIDRLGDFTLIFCGKQAIDGDTAQVGPEIAEILDIAHVTYVQRVCELNEESITAERMIEGGYEVIRAQLPALITVVKDINQPRLPTMRGIMRARRTQVTVWGMQDLDIPAADVGLEGSPTEVIRVFTPELSAGGEMISGEPAEQAAALASILRDTGLV